MGSGDIITDIVALLYKILSLRCCINIACAGFIHNLIKLHFS